jgi:hypothetical protein
MRNWIGRPVKYAKSVTQTVTVGLQQGDRLLALRDNNIYSPDNGGIAVIIKHLSFEFRVVGLSG